MIDTKKINERIAQNILSEADHIYENYGENAFVDYIDSLTEEQRAIVEESDHWSTYVIPGANLYQNAKRGKTGFNMDTAKAAGWDALNAAAAIPLVRGARSVLAGMRAAKAATTASGIAAGASSAEKAKNIGAVMGTPRNAGAIAKGTNVKPTGLPAGPSSPMGARTNIVAGKMASASSKGADDAIKAAKGVVSGGKATAGQKAAAIAGGAAVGAAAGTLQNKSNKDAADALKPTPNEQGRMDAAKSAKTLTPTPKPTKPVSSTPAAPTQKTVSEPKKEKSAVTSSAPKKQKSDTGGVPSMQSSLDTHGTAMGRYGKEAQKSMFREEKTSLADFRMLQERIMRKSNGSF